MLNTFSPPICGIMGLYSRSWQQHRVRNRHFDICNIYLFDVPRLNTLPLYGAGVATQGYLPHSRPYIYLCSHCWLIHPYCTNRNRWLAGYYHCGNTVGYGTLWHILQVVIAPFDTSHKPDYISDYGLDYRLFLPVISAQRIYSSISTNCRRRNILYSGCLVLCQEGI